LSAVEKLDCTRQRPPRKGTAVSEREEGRWVRRSRETGGLKGSSPWVARWRRRGRWRHLGQLVYAEDGDAVGEHHPARSRPGGS